MTRMPSPRCRHCGLLAADMPSLDKYWAESQDEIDGADDDTIRRNRIEEARADETYNTKNGHFYCDACYFSVGMPLGEAP